MAAFEVRTVGSNGYITLMFKAHPPIDVEESLDDDTIKGIESGELVHFDAEVLSYIVLLDQQLTLSSDYLGNCVYQSIDEFLDCDYFKDMLETVKLDAKLSLSQLKGTFTHIDI